MSDKVLTPVTLWESFDDSLPLKDVKLNTYTVQSANISSVYFSGRQTKMGRVRIYGSYAEPIQGSKASLLLLPDVCDTVDSEMVMHCVKLGFNVLCLDFRGEYHDTNEFTKYPEDISYANYLNRGRTFDYVDSTADKTCWYEWVAVARYGISYLKEKNPNAKIGILGNKYSSNICWQLAATDKRVDAAIFLFGAGWHAYKNIYKQSDNEIEYNEERCKFLAGIEAQSYAQYVECPVLYLGTTNNELFDAERAVDTLSRVKNQNTCYFNFISTSKNVLDDHALKNVELFLSKYLLGKKISFPKVPTMELDVDDEDIVYTLKIDDLENVSAVYLMSNSNDIEPSTRVWGNVLSLCKTKGNKLVYKKHIYGVNNFEVAYFTVKYNNGLTISSKFYYKNINQVSSSKVPGIIFSSTKMPTNFIIEDIKNELLGNVFSLDSLYNIKEGPNNIRGIYSINTLTSYAIKNLTNIITEESFVKFDAYSPIPDKLTIVLTLSSGVEFKSVYQLTGGEFWQNVKLNFVDFKDINGMPMKKFDEIISVSLKSAGALMINNFILI